MSEQKMGWCAGCDQEHPSESMISLDGYHHTVCRACWATMRPFERILLNVLSVTGFDSEGGGGLGIGFELSSILGLIEKFFRAFHGHDPDNVCPQCDPLGYRQQQEARRMRQSAKKENP